MVKIYTPEGDFESPLGYHEAERIMSRMGYLAHQYQYASDLIDKRKLDPRAFRELVESMEALDCEYSCLHASLYFGLHPNIHKYMKL